ncbi:MAG: Stp1/IreP family PP2C-type Ser/Thr phosphatase [Oscillospiraceae bacterium]|nr:Stp1/IreP family PP2C-type Ser/Thr phosphatase [Oscillospiraceae bacterium]
MQAWGVSDRGIVREKNEDSFAIRKLSDKTMLAVVCDGMGGAKAGKVASTLALDVFAGEVERAWREPPSADRTAKVLLDALAAANSAVYEQAQGVEDYDGMGTTLVAAIVRGDRASILNIGDSRAYHFGESGVRCITTDHSLVQQMVEQGELTAEEARRHPLKNIITRAIGTEFDAAGDVFHVELQKGECLLLCSDGLYNVVTDQELLYEVVHGENRDDCCSRLLEIAKTRGAPDNVTAILICV